MKTIINILCGNVMFDVDGKRFFLYMNALSYYNNNKAKELNALNFFTGWKEIKSRPMLMR